MAEYVFDAKQMKDRAVAWIREFFEVNGPGCNAVLGVSGGKDSSICAALCVEALGKDRVVGVLMPNGEQADIDMSRLLVEHLGIRYIVVNIKEAYDGALSGIKNAELKWCGGTNFAVYNPKTGNRVSTFTFYIKDGKAWGVKCGSRIFMRESSR